MEDQESSFYNQYRQLRSEKKFEETIALCDSFISQGINPENGYIFKAQSFFEDFNEPDKAKEALMKCLEINERNYEAIGLLGFYYRNFEKDNKKAEEYYLKSVEVNPKYVKGLNNLGFFYNNVRGDLEKASKYYEQVLKIDEEGQQNVSFQYLLNILMFFYTKQKNERMCERVCDAFLERHKDSLDESIIEFSYQLYSKYNKYQKLIKLIKFQLEKDPEKEELQENIKQFEIKEQKLIYVESKLLDLQEKEPENEEILKSLINFYRDDMVDDQKAKLMYDLAISKYPSSSYYLNDYATFSILIFKDYEKAEKLLRTVKSDDPKFKASRQNLIVLFRDIMEDYEKFEQYLIHLIEEEDPNNEDNYEELISFYKYIRKEKKAREVAIAYKKKFWPEVYETQKITNKELIPLLSTMGKDFLQEILTLLKNSGQNEEIEEAYELYLKNNENDVEEWIYYALYLVQDRQNIEKAEKIFLDAYKLSPNHEKLTQHIYEFYLCDLKNTQKVEDFLISHIDKNNTDQNAIQNAFAFFLKEGKTELSKKYHQLFYQNRKDDKDIRMIYPSRLFFE